METDHRCLALSLGSPEGGRRAIVVYAGGDEYVVTGSRGREAFLLRFLSRAATAEFLVTFTSSGEDVDVELATVSDAAAALRGSAGAALRTVTRFFDQGTPLHRGTAEDFDDETAMSLLLVLRDGRVC